MLKKRLIAALIVRDAHVVQSVQFQHTNVIHQNPVTAIDFFDRWAVDEIVLLDVGRDKEAREDFYRIVDEISRKCFVPLTVGGWIDSVDEVRKMLRMGADKVVINTQAIKQKTLVTDCARTFGKQCIVVSIDVRKAEDGTYQVYCDRGREPTGLNPVEWAREVRERGAGEIFLNCVERDGFRQGYDLDLLKSVVDAVDIPVIAMGGVLSWQHLVDGILVGGADAAAAANIFHYTEHATKKAKAYMRQAGIDVR